MAVTKWLRKPEPVKREGIVAAQYQPGEALDDLRKIAGMAFRGEVAECALPSGPVLLAAWEDIQRAARRCEVVRPGEWLCFSGIYGGLAAEDDAASGTSTSAMSSRRLALWLSLLIGLPVAGAIFVTYASEYSSWPLTIWGAQQPGNDLVTIALMLADVCVTGALIGKWMAGGK